MRCFKPLDAWRTDGGEVVFADRGDGRHLVLRCGQCIGCRVERSRQWASRCVHEASLYEDNSFVTLTFRDDPISLSYRPFQDFLKRARRKLGPFRFYMCGEYGEKRSRPHYHALLFGLGFRDRYPWRMSPSGFQLYRSPSLESVWTGGSSEVGDVSFESAAYIARYCVEKITGDRSEDHYSVVDVETGEVTTVAPEFTRMSLKPGIGAEWFKRYRSEVFRADGDVGVLVNGVRIAAPRYYRQLAQRYVDDVGVLCEGEAVGFDKGVKFGADKSPERLAVQERVTRARYRFKVRKLSEVD